MKLKPSVVWLLAAFAVVVAATAVTFSPQSSKLMMLADNYVADSKQK
jgi:hypothetical protein